MLADVVILISLGLTVTFVMYGLELISLWWPTVREAHKKPRKEWKPSDRLANGIVVGFSASILDNLYWGLTWACVLFQGLEDANGELTFGAYLMLLGSTANIFFRQLGGITAASEHVSAATSMHKDTITDYQKFYWYAGALSLIILTGVWAVL